MGNRLGSFLGSVQVRTKHTEKTGVGMWEQSSIRKAVVTIGIGFFTQPEVWPIADVDVRPQKQG